MKAALAVLAFLPFVAQAGVEHKTAGAQPPGAAVAAERHAARDTRRFDQMVRYLTKHMRPKPGRCSA